MMKKEGIVGIEIREVTVEELLGRGLNNVEKYYAPRKLYIAGKLPLPLRDPRVAVIGTRNPSEEGLELARQIVEKLVERGFIIVSGLARGIDTRAHRTAIENRGRTVAVLGTPLNRYYPPENRELQEFLAREHLVVSQFPAGHVTQRRDFVLRNRTMALISDATMVVEAGETSGVVSQCWEAVRLGRPLFLTKLLLKKGLRWPSKLQRYGARVLRDIDQSIEEVLETSLTPPPSESEIRSILDQMLSQ